MTTTVRSRQEWLTTGEAAELLGTSRQHVVNLCDRGALPVLVRGAHRRVLRRDIEELISRSAPLTRDQQRSLWLNHAVAGEVAKDPARALAIARRNLGRLQQAHPRGQAARWLKDWQELLEGGAVEDILEVLTSRSMPARELRQNSPFAGVLSEQERTAVLKSFRQVSNLSLA
jgi:excisionase family DNA binding protein